MNLYKFFEAGEIDESDSQKLEVFIPDKEQIAKVKAEILESDDNGEARAYFIEINEKNENELVENEVMETKIPWPWSLDKTEAACFSIEDLMKDIAGYSWMEADIVNSFSLCDLVELLERKCFVQVSHLEISNIESCIGEGGKILALVPEREWCIITNSEIPECFGISGMRAIEITMDESRNISAADHMIKEGRNIRLSSEQLNWLEDSWILEVYK